SPFLGDAQGASWNSQALFARKRRRHGLKDSYVRRLLQNRDFVAIADSHGLEGKTAVWSCPPDCTSFFSPGTSTRAGAGLIIKKTFLDKFEAGGPRWIHLVPGRAAPGALDVHVVYFTTGTPGMVQPLGMAVDGALTACAREQRSHMRQAISAAMSPKEEVLSMVMGGFNWVAAPEDRMVKSTGEFSVADDAAEQREAMATLWSPAGLYEVRQDEPTHECAHAWSRLDRCYWNADRAGQQDRHMSCTALEWVPHLSAHRAIAFGRRTPARRDAGAAPIRPEIVADVSWPLRVAAVYHELRTAAVMVAMRITADQMLQESSATAPEPSLDENVGHALRFIRAVELGATGVMQQCIRACPRLGALAPSPPELASARGRQLQPRRQLAVELARGSALEELSALQAQRGELTEHEVGARRSRIHAKLKNGEILTDPNEMADALRQHWQDVFAQRPVDEQLLEQWVRDDAPPQVPPPDADAWALRRSRVQKALEQSPNSAPGPDGLSFAAWRRPGPLAVDVLWNALQAITAEADPEYFEGFITTFNSSLMVFLPKGAGVTHRGLTGHRPADTRPLNVACCDNRALANAVRTCEEEPLSEAVSTDQKGFTPGRSMLSNVVDVDECMMHTALQHTAGAAWFFDFQAAFPGIARSFLRRLLRAAGLPPWLLRFVDAPYME
ncbi:unnamed protein product, partial [Prorocentrum cordatum]